MRRLLRLGLGLAVFTAACGGSSSAPATTTPTVTTTEGSTSTTSVGATSTPATATTTASDAPTPVDLILTGGPIVTMDPDLGTAEAIAIDGDRIVAVGSATDIARYAGLATTVIELDGRTVQPGFVDPHTHILTDMGGIEAGQAVALANGITSLADASVEPNAVSGFRDASLSGLLRVRTSLYLVRGDVCGEDLGTWYEVYPEDSVFGDRVRVAGVKIFADGGVCGALATSEPILDGYDSGPPFHDVATLTEMIRTADAGGYQVIVHAQGDVAIGEVQDAYAAVLDGGPNVMRHRIEHNAIQTAATIGRYGELGLIPTLFGPSEACRADLPWTDFYKEHGDRPGDLIAANPGLIVAWHGDDPWMTPISPIYELFSLVTRGRVGDDGVVCGPAEWMKGAEVARDQALEMMTVNAAYALRQEDMVGSLTPGKYADLLVLTDNLLTIPAESIPDVRLMATIIGGVTEFCLAGAEAWCPGIEPRAIQASASASRAGHGPDLVLDGVVGGESFWSSGADAPGWIRIDLAEPATVTAVRFTVYQNPPGDTVHELELLIDGDWIPVETFQGFTTTGDVLTWRPAEPMENVVALRMTTTASPSWPEWFEIEVDTADG
jgi:predicted amidohydrolase YtcJ